MPKFPSDNPKPERQSYTMAEIGKFLNDLGFKEQFIVEFTEEFQKREWKGEEYIVWVESFDPRDKELQFFYDDGDELDEFYPDIICRPEDIASIRKI